MVCDLRTVLASLVLGAMLAVATCKPRDEHTASTTAGAAAGASARGGLSANVHSSGPPCMGEREPHDGGVVRGFSCYLANDYTVDGYDCVAGKLLELYVSGKLKGCSLKAPRALDGWSCQDGLSLFPSGKLRRCKVTTLRTLDAGTTVRAGDWVTVFEGGGMRRLELAKGPHTIQGLTCQGYLNFFHESGRLKKCELAEDTIVDGKRISARTEAGASVFVCLDTRGARVDCATLSGMTLE